MNNHLLLPLLALTLASCQSPESTEPITGIPFLHQQPHIDGRLDPGLEILEARPFSHIWQFDNPPGDTTSVTYRMAYTPEHLYLYFEAASDSINYRRRGFVNGDGYKLLLTLPQPDSLTDEFYDIFFSPSRDPDYWTRQRIWTYNALPPRRALSAATESQELAYDGKSGFEALIAWCDIPPYHPWFTERMGHNLYFAKAIGDTITHGYSLLEDEGIWDEAIPRRNYLPLSFATPQNVDRSYLQSRVTRPHLRVGEKLVIASAGVAPQAKAQKLTVEIDRENGETLLRQELSLALGPQLERYRHEIDLTRASDGNYRVRLLSEGDTLEQRTLCLLPQLDLAQYEEAIQDNPRGGALGAQNTLLFKRQRLERLLDELKSYESAEAIYDYWREFDEEYQAFLDGRDPYAGRTEAYRRAFRSTYDQSLQPYSIRFPKNYDPQLQYPLLVFLHGSSVDDRGLLNAPRSNGEFIEIAPFGRDKYYCYASDSSQTDIAEAIADAARHFSIDRERVIIGGFSMGGYGALRTYYEHPELYCGVAVMAGHPYLASMWLEGPRPHFLQAEYLSAFKDLPVFIYHGEQDGSLDVAEAKNLAVALREAGARVTSRWDVERGHAWPTPETVAVYHDWLQQTQLK
ncbi:MAG: alpha/beta hydrolase-fold protein [Bacteroidota bacterium]